MTVDVTKQNITREIKQDNHTNQELLSCNSLLLKQHGNCGKKANTLEADLVANLPTSMKRLESSEYFWQCSEIIEISSPPTSSEIRLIQRHSCQACIRLEKRVKYWSISRIHYENKM